MTAEKRIASALRTLPGQHILSSSFGAQSAVMLHLVTQQAPDIPVVLIDTGYLFPETYNFIDETGAEKECVSPGAFANQSDLRNIRSSTAVRAACHANSDRLVRQSGLSQLLIKLVDERW